MQHCNMSLWGVDILDAQVVSLRLRSHEGTAVFICFLLFFLQFAKKVAYSILDTLAESCPKGFAPTQPLGLRRWDVGCEKM